MATSLTRTALHGNIHFHKNIILESGWLETNGLQVLGLMGIRGEAKDRQSLPRPRSGGRRSYHGQRDDTRGKGLESFGLDMEVRSIRVLGYFLGVLVAIRRMALGYDFGDRAAVQAEGICNAIPSPFEDWEGVGGWRGR